MNDRLPMGMVVKGTFAVVINVMWIDFLVKFVMPLLWEIHKAINVHGAR
jgi:hypothetical protein